MRVRFLLVLLAFSLTGCATTADTDKSYKLYLVRHAEKQADGSRDPALTEAGKQRSQQLANWLQDKHIKDIWSSDYKRTRDTAKPLLSSLGLQLNIYDPGDLTALSKNLLDKQHNALIVGHSNTTPELARLLCQCDIEDMVDSEYDRLIEISVVDGETQVAILQQDRLSQQ